MFSFHISRIVLGILTIALTLSLLWAGSTSSAAFGLFNPSWDGANELQSIAEESGVETKIVRNTTSYEKVPPSGTIAIIIAPAKSYRAVEVRRIEQFIKNGGTLVLAEDFEPYGNQLLSRLGADTRYDGDLLRDERFYYRSPSMPVAPHVSENSSLRGVSSVTLNRGTALKPHGAEVLVRTSEFAYLDRNFNEKLDPNESLNDYPVVVAETLGEGRIIAISDPSSLINAMLDQPGNRELVIALFEPHERVFLDYSHAQPIPPLTLMVLTIRTSPGYQLVIGFMMILCIFVLEHYSIFRSDHRLYTRIQQTWKSSRDPTSTVSPMSESAIMDYFQNRHPEWEETRIKRLARAIIRSRPDTEDDD